VSDIKITKELTFLEKKVIAYDFLSSRDRDLISLLHWIESIGQAIINEGEGGGDTCLVHELFSLKNFLYRQVGEKMSGIIP
jgi:hypothetical protein